jgi:magnesium transporter
MADRSLAIEDALHAHQRPKLEQYGDTTFLVMRTAFLVDGHIELGETEMFLGRGYIISIRHGASASYARVRECAEAAPQRLAHGEDYVLYAIVDFIVDNYLAVVTPLAEEVEALEERVLSPPLDETKIARIYDLKRELQRYAWWWHPPPRSVGGSRTWSCRASILPSDPTSETLLTT